MFVLIHIEIKLTCNLCMIQVSYNISKFFDHFRVNYRTSKILENHTFIVVFVHLQIRSHFTFFSAFSWFECRLLRIYRSIIFHQKSRCLLTLTSETPLEFSQIVLTIIVDAGNVFLHFAMPTWD